MGFARLNWPHLHRAYAMTVPFILILAVHAERNFSLKQLKVSFHLKKYGIQKFVDKKFWFLTQLSLGRVKNLVFILYHFSYFWVTSLAHCVLDCKNHSPLISFWIHISMPGIFFLQCLQKAYDIIIFWKKSYKEAGKNYTQVMIPMAYYDLKWMSPLW